MQHRHLPFRALAAAILILAGVAFGVPVPGWLVLALMFACQIRLLPGSAVVRAAGDVQTGNAKGVCRARHCVQNADSSGG